MNARAAIIALAVTLAHGVAAAFILQPEDAPAAEAGGELVTFRPSQATAIEITHPGGETMRLQRDGDRWALAWNAAPDRPRRWPVEASHVRAALRLLAEQLRPAPGAEPPAADAATQLRIETDSGPWQIALAPPRVGGVAAASATPPGGERRTARTESPLHAMFERPALLAWRSRRALPATDARFQRIAIEAGPRAVELARRDGRWNLTAPISLRADSERVQALLSGLGSMEAQELLDPDDFTTDEIGTDPPNALVLCEHAPRRDQDHTRITRLRLGDPADAAGETFYALLDTRRIDADGEETTTFGPMLAIVEGGQLRAVSPLPEAYASRRALHVPTADIRALAIETASAERTYTRTLGRWQHDGGDADRTAAQRLDALLQLITAAPAHQLALQPPTGMDTLATVQARSLDGEPLGEIAIATATIEGQSHVVLARRGVFRLYPAEPLLPLLSWLEQD